MYGFNLSLIRDNRVCPVVHPPSIYHNHTLTPVLFGGPAQIPSSVTLGEAEGGNSTGGLASNGITLTYPEVVNVGELLFAKLTSDNPAASFDNVATWTKIADTQHSTLNVHSAIFYKVANGTEADGSEVFPLASLATGNLMGEILTMRGGDYVSITTSQGLDNGDGTITVPSVDYTNSGAVLQYVSGDIDADYLSNAAPAGWNLVSRNRNDTLSPLIGDITSWLSVTTNGAETKSTGDVTYNLGGGSTNGFIAHTILIQNS